MKVIKKLSSQSSPGIISQNEVAIVNNNDFILTESVKVPITLKYDANGYCNAETVDLGVQYDHKVKWLTFDLDELLWHIAELHGYALRDVYNNYTFKLAASTQTSTTVWEFDGVTFEIPRELTKNAGSQSIVLIIEEYQGDQNSGNISPDDRQHLERFVTKPIKGYVTRSFYNPDSLLNDIIKESHQKASLKKPTINCQLTDNGVLTISSNRGGEHLDNYIRYLSFNPKDITAHLNHFNMWAIFSLNDKFYYSYFERTNPDDPLDQYDPMFPAIAWIPSEVYETAGNWHYAILAISGNIEDVLTNADAYRYVSYETRLRINRNRLTIEDLNKDPIINIDNNFITQDNKVLITSEDKVFETKTEVIIDD